MTIRAPRRRAVIQFVLVAVSALCASTSVAADAVERPNIVWVFVEDMSANFGCYGEGQIETPNVDRLAAQGLKFQNAVVTAPVCSACRSALITGMYQTSIGAHHHRSGRGTEKIQLPSPVRLIPALFQEAGYRTLNLSFEEFVRPADAVARNDAVRVAKTDYNFEWDQSVYDRKHWSVGAEPFFCQVQLHGGKLRGHGDGERWPARVVDKLGSRTDAADVELPPYLPRHPVILEDWAQYLDTCRWTDWEVGQILARLEEAGELDETVVFFLTDHGISHVRNKQYCYDGGMHVPLVVFGPGIPEGEVRDDPVEQIDLGATSLALAGIPVPAWMQGRHVLAEDYVPRRYGVCARDRCDETVDRIRALRSGRWKYIRNFYPERPYLQPNRYKDAKPIVRTMRELHEAGELTAEQARIMADSRPPEELYDLQADPFERTNLAGDAAHREQLVSMRQALADWIAWSGDRGQQPEPAAMYDSDMGAYLGSGATRQTEARQTLLRNIELMKRWAAEGK